MYCGEPDPCIKAFSQLRPMDGGIEKEYTPALGSFVKELGDSRGSTAQEQLDCSQEEMWLLGVCFEPGLGVGWTPWCQVNSFSLRLAPSTLFRSETGSFGIMIGGWLQLILLNHKTRSKGFNVR